MGLNVPGWVKDEPRWGNMSQDGPWMSLDGAKMCQDGLLGDSFEASWEPPGGILGSSWRSLG
eukprot:8383021-Karenia_brevis.AAC.1